MSLQILNWIFTPSVTVFEESAFKGAIKAKQSLQQ
jgi:hypothetical protein